MRRMIIYLLLVAAITATLLHEGYGARSWQYWVCLLAAGFIHLNASFD